MKGRFGIGGDGLSRKLTDAQLCHVVAGDGSGNIGNGNGNNNGTGALQGRSSARWGVAEKE
jgi:hypothetical protein